MESYNILNELEEFIENLSDKFIKNNFCRRNKKHSKKIKEIN